MRIIKEVVHVPADILEEPEFEWLKDDDLFQYLERINNRDLIHDDEFLNSIGENDEVQQERKEAA